MSPESNNPLATPETLLLMMARACHPARWALCAVGLAASLLLAELTLAVVARAPVQLEEGLRDPLTELQRLGEQLVGQGSGTAIFRCCLLAGVLSLVWSLVGGWIARSELLRHRARADPVQTTAARFVGARAASLCMLLPTLLFAAGFFLMLGLMAGLLNLALGWGVGAVLVSLFFPVVLIPTLFSVLLLVGALSYGIMPATLAAEGSDCFEGWSRGCSYLYQRPLLLAWWSGLCLALSALPLGGVLGLLHAEPDLLDSEARLLAMAAASALSLSFFWTLQGLVYLKMRRAVDGTPEGEIWDGPTLRKDAPLPSAPTETDPDSQAKTSEGEPDKATSAEAALPRRDSLSFPDTLDPDGALHLGRSVVLLLGMLWLGLVLAGGARVVWLLTVGAGQGMTLAGLHQAIGDLAEQSPEELFGIAAGVVLLGALGLGRPIKAAARMAAVQLVFKGETSMRSAWSFVGRTRSLAIGSVLIATAGIALLLVTGFLVPLAIQEERPWEEVVLVGALAAGVLELGALGLAAVAVEGNREVDRPGMIGTYLGNGLETGTAAAAALVLIPLRSLALLGIAWLSWFLTCESISWWGGENVQWARWGLGGSLVPASEGGLYWLASVIAGFWFLLLFGLWSMYALSSFLTWGAACYLRARQQTQEVPPGQIELSKEEEEALRLRQQKRKMLQERARTMPDRLKARRLKPEQAPSEVAKVIEEGHDSAAPQVKLRCLKCRALNDESARFCNQCGAAL
jgi:hypothetical protein